METLCLIIIAIVIIIDELRKYFHKPTPEEKAQTQAYMDAVNNMTPEQWEREKEEDWEKNHPEYSQFRDL
jgi:hypothetical protein